MPFQHGPTLRPWVRCSLFFGGMVKTRQMLKNCGLPAQMCLNPREIVGTCVSCGCSGHAETLPPDFSPRDGEKPPARRNFSIPASLPKGRPRLALGSLGDAATAPKTSDLTSWSIGRATRRARPRLRLSRAPNPCYSPNGDLLSRQGTALWSRATNNP